MGEVPALIDFEIHVMTIFEPPQVETLPHALAAQSLPGPPAEGLSIDAATGRIYQS